MEKILERNFSVANYDTYFNFSKKDKIKMCKNCSAYCYNGVWHDEAPQYFTGRLHREIEIKMVLCSMCVYLKYRKNCLICRNSEKGSLCSVCKYLYYKANNSLGGTMAVQL